MDDTAAPWDALALPEQQTRMLERFTPAEWLTNQGLLVGAVLRHDDRQWYHWKALAKERGVDTFGYEKGVDKLLKDLDIPRGGHASREHVLFIEGDTIEDEDIVYLWDPYFPRKMASILDGEPGAGKTMLACQMAASVSRGYPLPDQQGTMTISPGEAGNVLMVAMEDHLAAVVKKRLVACGADMSKITFVNDIVDDEGNARPFTLGDIPLLTAYMACKRPRFVYIDAIQAVLGATVDINRANQVTALLRPLKTLAEAYDCAIVCSRHPAKPGQNVPKLIHRGMASQAFVGTARSALYVEEHPSDKSKSLLVHYKSNTGELGRTQIFSKAGKVEWCGITRITKDTLSGYSGKGASPQAVLEACLWLEERLEGNRAWNAKDIETEAEAQDIASHTLRRAKKTLRVISAKGSEKDAPWTWRLPPLRGCLETKPL
jgi:hypothetical protein